MRNRLERLYDDLNMATHDVHHYWFCVRDKDLDLTLPTNKMYIYWQTKYDDAVAREKALVREILEVEACEHVDYEETLVDESIWHRVCLDCGKVTEIETKDIPW